MSNNNEEQAQDYVEERRLRGANGSVFERHAQTVLAGLVTIGILWIVSSLNTLNKSQTETGAEIRILKYEVNALRESVSAATSNHVKMDSFLTSRANCLNEIQELKDRIKEVERRGGTAP